MNKELEKFNEACEGLPPYCFDFFAAKVETQAMKTRIAYALDYRVFFHYLLAEVSDRFPYENITEITLKDLDKLDYSDIDKFVLYLSEYTLDGMVYKNSPAGKKRKISALKTFFKYFKKIGKLKHNPTEFTEMPKIREKEIVRLTKAQQEKLIEAAETGAEKSKFAMQFHERIRYRDIAILTLFLGTGLRISELVGIDECDLDLIEQRVLVTRKGGKQEFVYFNNTVRDALSDYLDFERYSLLGVQEGDEDLEIYRLAPLFVSRQHRRISCRMVEILVKRYANSVLPKNMDVSPHTLRKTFGTELYAKCRDLYLVQKALGHSSPSTTAKHYAAFDEEYLKVLREN